MSVTVINWITEQYKFFINYSNILLIFNVSSATYETVAFSCVIQDYHVDRNISKQKENEMLQCYHKSDNDYDLFATKTSRNAEFHQQIVGYVPLEISCFTKFLLDRGATLTATFSSTHYRRSTLVQGGLEIPCVANAKVISTIKKKVLAKYLEIFQTYYTEQ